MKNVVVHLTKCVKGSTVASSRIAFFLSEFLDLPLLHTNENFLELKDKEIDTILLVNSMSAFSSILDDLADLATRCKRIIWIQNDYTIYPPTQLRKILFERNDIIVERWSTIPQLPEEWANKKIWVKVPMKATHYVNWNMLTYDPLEPLVKRKHTDVLFYYGAYRQGREDLFIKYFQNPPYPVAISASSKAMDKFTDLNYKIIEVPVLKNLIPDMQQFGICLYLEDEASNDIYCSPANRFYECLSAGVPMLFDITSKKTMEQAGYDIDPYIVKSSNDVLNKMKDWKIISQTQYDDWRKDYRSILYNQIESAYNGL
jgi:hypothetical protein